MDPDQKVVIIDWECYCTPWTVYFTKLWRSAEFADVCIRCDGRVIMCHSLILAAHSQSFRSAFLQTKNIGVGKVKLREMKAILAFMYTGTVTIERDQLGALLEAAKILWVTRLVDLIEAKSFATFEEFNCAQHHVRAQGQHQGHAQTSDPPDTNAASAVFRHQPMSMSTTVNEGVENPQRPIPPLLQQNSAHLKTRPPTVPASILDKLKELGTVVVEINEDVAPKTETAFDPDLGYQIIDIPTAPPNFETVARRVLAASSRGRQSKHSKEVREKAMEVLRSGEMSLTEYSKKSGIKPSVLRDWWRAIGSKIPHGTVFPVGGRRRAATLTSVSAKLRTKSEQYERLKQGANLIRQGLNTKAAAELVQVATSSLSAYLKLQTRNSALVKESSSGSMSMQSNGSGAMIPGQGQGYLNWTGNEMRDGRGEPKPETESDMDISCNEILKIEMIEGNYNY